MRSGSGTLKSRSRPLKSCGRVHQRFLPDQKSGAEGSSGGHNDENQESSERANDGGLSSVACGKRRDSFPATAKGGSASTRGPTRQRHECDYSWVVGDRIEN